ncbi:type II secretion system F family protein [Acetivibrio clariflavus]|uniref:Flp pilus assembly protein TadC n=1 Tax=Acetivibrio clariflavus (strain DSM 19732 / NBRC 101661 / EBR45) TaxID=720554 RepID=G8LSP8_ACECE|nr:type II secretion system F family protein [Acetivibrio clariflavus]AEV69400.1 Flp pilus assembly protein TadC [Acetivibrio clariflavus DSM 19732]
MQINTGILVIFLIVAGGILVLFLLSSKKYKEFIEPLDPNEYKLKNFLPIGLYVTELIKYNYGSNYDRRLMAKIIELYGVKYSQYYLRIHWSNKIVLVLMTAFFLSLFGLSGEPDWDYGIFALIVLVISFFLPDNELDNKIKERRTSIQLDFPDFLNKLTLLINAGMTVTRAWEKIVTDSKKDSVLYEELSLTIADIRSGKPEILAYEDFAKRCKIPEITKFVSVVVQNMKKGNSEMVSILRLQAAECWEMRKRTAKRLGEELSTKLLFPMMIMFMAILIIVAAPAIFAMRGM